MKATEIVQAARVGPDDVLVIAIPESAGIDAGPTLAEELAVIGLAGRSLVISADGVEIRVVEKDRAEPPAVPPARDAR